ncbi:dihydropteroate synthase [bacterium]|nr:dihydropteroate synthase [bacterium]
MHDFVLKEIINTDISNELQAIGFDKSYIHKACDKFAYKNIKLFNLTVAQANILKQTALSVGADCATHRETITGKIDKTDCILGGSIAQLEKIADKLVGQPFGLKELGTKIKNIHAYKKNKTQIVGILNLTTNSFSDGGRYYNTEAAIKHLEELIEDGADIIDIGAESTKPGAFPVPAEEQLEKIVPILNYLGDRPIIVSIDTRSSVVAEECLKLGVEIINDVSGFDYDPKMPEIVAKYGAKIIIQHSQGSPENMQDNPHYSNLMDEIYLGLKSKVEFAVSRGVKKENIIIDPGIGFGKTRKDNFEIIHRFEELYGLACPVMLGVSRKSLLSMPNEDNFTKDIFTVVLNTLVVNKNVDYIRVHNVKLHSQLLELL